MKYVALSFDDARSDTYEVAFPLLKRYGIKATVNVISDYILNPQKYNFMSAPKAMTREQILEWQNAGFEVACHGNTHKNTVEDIIDNIEQLRSFGVDVKNIGFASPNSELTRSNIQDTGIDELKRNGIISYIRSGIQVRREGLFYMAGAAIEKTTHSKQLFWILNKRNIANQEDFSNLIPSVAVKNYTSLKQLTHFIKNIEDNCAVTMMFHSILKKDSKYYGTDSWYWDADSFEKFLAFLTANQEIKVVTSREMVELYRL